MWHFIQGMTSGAWSAIAAWFAVFVGTGTIIVTGWFARKQIVAAQAQLVAANKQIEQAKLQLKESEKARESQERQAQQLRKEQAQPNVVAFMEPTKDHWGFVDLVVRNYGSTPARDVHLSFTPELNVAPVRTTAGELLTEMAHPDVIPFLAPGQEWRSVWDYSKRRFDADKKTAIANESLPEADRLPPLVSRFDATVTFTDSSGEPFVTKSILDWDHLNTRMTIETKTTHDIARTLDEQLKKVNKGLEKIDDAVNDLSAEGAGVWVYVGDAQQLRDDRAAEQARRSAELQRMQDEMWSSRRGVQPARGEPNPPAEPDQGAPAEPAQSEGE